LQIRVRQCIPACAFVVVLLSACMDTGSESTVQPAAEAEAGESGDAVMPDVMCMTLQSAQDRIQENGVAFSKSVDATGEGRKQLVDRNWVVVDQTPAAGAHIGEGDPVLSVVKKGEPSICDSDELDVEAAAALVTTNQVTSTSPTTSAPTTTAAPATTTTSTVVSTTTLLTITSTIASTTTTRPPTTTATVTAAPTTRPPPTVAFLAPAPVSDCDPNYAGACVPIASDVDCAGGSGNGPAYVDGPVNVVGSDIYGLDRDGNGVGCD
jgi:hypothetical protein